MIHRKIKSLTCLALCLVLLSGCSNKEENQNITESSAKTESTVKLDAPVKTDSTTSDNVQAVTEKVDTVTESQSENEVVDTKTKPQQTKEVKPVTLTEEEFYSRDLVIPDNKPFEMTISFGSVNITAAINQSTNDMYYNFAGNEFMYIDGVNYLIDKNNPMKCKGENIMLSDDLVAGAVSTDTDVEESLSMLDTLKINDISVVSDIIIVNGDSSYSGTTTPVTLKIDYNTYEFISLTINQADTYVSLNMLDSWKDLPDFNYKEVDAETIEERAKQSILMVMAGAFSSAFSEESLTGSDSSSSEEINLHEYKIEIENSSEVFVPYINTFINDSIYDDYDIFTFSSDEDSDNVIITFNATRELSDKELSSIKNEIIEFMENDPKGYVDEVMDTWRAKTYEYKIDLGKVSISDNLLLQVNDFIDDTFTYKYYMLDFYNDIGLDNSSYTICTTRELTDEELISFKDAVLEFIDSNS